MQELSGAGGNWRVIDEIVDANVVQQQDNLSCGPACGEMLLRNRGVNEIDRYAIASESGVPISPQVLASVLNALNSTSSADRWVDILLVFPGHLTFNSLRFSILQGHGQQCCGNPRKASVT